MKKCNCFYCNEHIDRSSCNNNYAILTLVNNVAIPITNDRKYICKECLDRLQYDLDHTIGSIFF